MNRRGRPVAAVAAAAAVLILGACGTAGSSAAPAQAGSTASAGANHSHGPVAEPVFALRTGERVLSLTMARPYRPKAPHGGTDDYRCFLIDPKLATSSFITGIGFVPGNEKAVHHAILFRVPSDRVAAAERIDREQAGDGWTCFGGTQVGDSREQTARIQDSGWLAAWAPGGKPTTMDDGVGVPVEAGSRVVLQVHYNLLAGDEPDQTGLRLRLTPASPGIVPLETLLFPAPVELPCTSAEQGALCDREKAVLDVMSRFGDEAGRTVADLQLLCGGDPARPRPGAVQQCDRRIETPMTVRAAAGHMHLLGRSVRITLNPGAPGERVLLDVPSYDFDNQGAVPLAKPVQVKPGETVRVTCTHDAKLRAMIPQLSKQQPRYVVWGEGTSDEMCLGILTVTRP
jgi:hypothetical protein